MSGDREGPGVRIAATCAGCKHERTVSYRAQGDSGSDVYCDHPDRGGRHVADSRWDTPTWCPLLRGAVELLIKRTAETPP